MSLDVHSLYRKVKLGNKAAKKVYPLRKQGNLLLCTLLLGNVAVNSTLAIFLGSLTQGVYAGIIATGLIVVFGEIIPQSVLSRHALRYGSKVTWLVYFFLYILYPISKPLAMGLDSFLGGELPTIYSKKEFKHILREQKKLMKSDIQGHEYDLLYGGLKLSQTTVKRVMTPRVNTFFIRKSAILSKTKIKQIHNTSHTRIPVYGKNRDHIVGILYVKDFLAIHSRRNVVVKDIMRDIVHFVKESDKLDKVLHLFQEKRTHLFVVRDRFNGVSGIVTLEDILEEIVGEIVDEDDKKIDMRKMD